MHCTCNSYAELAYNSCSKHAQKLVLSIRDGRWNSDYPWTYVCMRSSFDSLQRCSKGNNVKSKKRTIISTTQCSRILYQMAWKITVRIAIQTKVQPYITIQCNKMSLPKNLTLKTATTQEYNAKTKTTRIVMFDSFLMQFRPIVRWLNVQIIALMHHVRRVCVCDACNTCLLHCIGLHLKIENTTQTLANKTICIKTKRKEE